MRILRLVSEGDFAIEFHPFITVATGLTDEQRERIVRAFEDSARGRADLVTGLFEVHGVVLDLDERSLGMLDLPDSEPEVRVTAADLPGSASSGVGEQVRSAERALERLEQPHRDLLGALAAAEGRLADAESAEQEARDALRAVQEGPRPEPSESDDPVSDVVAGDAPGVDADADAETVLAGLDDASDAGAVGAWKARREELQIRRAELQAERDRLVVTLDPGAEQALAEARRLLQAAEAAAEIEDAVESGEPVAVPPSDGETSTVGGDPVADTSGDAPEGEVAGAGSEAIGPVTEPVHEPVEDPSERVALEEQVAQLETALELHRADDPDSVRDALDHLRLRHASGELVPSTEGLGLAERLDDLDRRIADLGEAAASAPPPPQLRSAEARLDEAQERLAEAERALPATRTTADQVADLERAHAAVEEARDAADRRVGRARAQRRLEEALEVEDEILGRLGLTSYTDYLTRGGTLRSMAEEAPELVEARAEVAQAEADLATLRDQERSALQHADLLEDRRTLRSRAREVLGDVNIADEALVAALSDLRVPDRDAGPVAGLVGALRAVGIPVPEDGLEEDELESLATDWLGEHGHTEARLTRRIDDLRTRLEGPADTDSSPAFGVDIELEVDRPQDDAAGDPDAEVASLDASAVSAVEPTADVAILELAEAVLVAEGRVEAHAAATTALTAIEQDLAEVDEELATDPPESDRSEIDDTSASDDDEDSDAAGGSATPQDAPVVADPERAESIELARARLEQSSGAVTEATRVLAEVTRSVDGSREAYDRAAEELAVVRQMHTDLDDQPPPVDEIEWYLLARLAALRQQSFAGSVPLVIDGALDPVSDDEGLVHLLDRLERMAGAVQIVHLSSDERIERWARALTDDRAAVVRPVTPVSG